MFPHELVVIGVHSAKFPSEQLTANIRQAVMRHGIEHPVVNDAGFKIWNAYAVRAWPTLVLIDPRGRIAGETSGEIQAEEFAQNIRELIAQDPSVIDPSPLALKPAAEAEPLRPLRYPGKLLVIENTLYLADSGHHRVLEIRLDPGRLGGDLLRVFGRGEAGLQDGPAGEAAFNHPHGLALRAGTLYIADTENHAIRAIDLSAGEVTTVAGTGQKAHGRMALGKPTETPLRSPWDVLVVGEYLLIAMAGSHQIWVLTDDGRIGPFAGNGYEALRDGPAAESSFNQPSDLALGMGYLFVADPEASAVRAISLDENPSTVTLVGQGLFEFGDVDGPASSALLQHPAGIAFQENQVYIADTYNNKIKLLDPQAAQVRSLVGSGQPGMQDGAFESARLFEPEGVETAGDYLFIADTNNHLVRVADLAARKLHTFQLRGIENLPVSRPPAVTVVTLQPARVAPGRVRLELDVRLPDGYKRNPDAPATIQVGQVGRPEKFAFSAGQPLAWEVEVRQDQDLPVVLTLYYCRYEQSQLCLIHDRSLVIPLRVDPGGEKEACVPYEVTVQE